jgi:hypothetical protein
MKVHALDGTAYEVPDVEMDSSLHYLNRIPRVDDRRQSDVFTYIISFQGRVAASRVMSPSTRSVKRGPFHSLPFLPS